MKHFLVLILLFGFTSVLAQGTDSIQYPYPTINKSFLKSCLTDAGAYCISPVHWKSRGWITFGSLSLTGAALYLLDENIRTISQENRNDDLDKLSNYGLEPLGSGKYTLPLMAGLYICGRLANNDRLSATTLSAAKSALFSGIAARVAKQAFHRHRPYQDTPADKTRWDGPFSDFHYTSFPSGHATFAWSVAAVYASEYRRTVWVPALAYSLATAVSLSRVYDDKHWISDAFAGAALGYATGKFVWKHNRAMQLYPAVSGKGVSFGVVYSFH